METLGAVLAQYGLVGALAAAAIAALVEVTRRYIARLEAADERSRFVLADHAETLGAIRDSLVDERHANELRAVRAAAREEQHERAAAARHSEILTLFGRPRPQG